MPVDPDQIIYRIYSRTQHEVNTDPQRRCYNGCHAKSELVWSEWGHLGTVFTEADAIASASNWGFINPGPRREYKWFKMKRSDPFEIPPIA